MNPLVELIGESPGIVAVREQIGRLLQRQSDRGRVPPILILGETGTGRTHLDLARLAHAAGASGAAARHVAEARRLFTALDVPRYLERADRLATELHAPRQTSSRDV